MNTKDHCRGIPRYSEISLDEINWENRKEAPLKAEWIEREIDKHITDNFPYPDWTSNCCNARLVEGTDICSKCHEGCEPINVVEELKSAVSK